MNKLEENIMKKVYHFETLDFCLRTGCRILLAGIFGFVGGLTAVTVLKSLARQQTFDLLDIVFEDIDTIRMYLADVAVVFFQEFPKIKFIFSLLAFVFSIFLMYACFKKFRSIKNKLKGLTKYWISHTH